MGDTVDSIRIGLVGSGNMASAMVAGWAAVDPALATRFVVTDRGSGRAAELAAHVGCTAAADNRELVAQSDVVMLCVKPIDIEDVLRQVSDLIHDDKLVASVAAGVQTATLENLLETGVPVLRVMPNVPVRVNAGTLVYATGRASTPLVGAAISALELLGTVVRLDERLFDAATALSGSGPAFFGLLMEAFEDAGIVSGLSASASRALAVSTMAGTAHMLEQEQLSCGELRRMVTSPGGTAATGLASMERSGVRGAIIDAVVAARDRARELG